MGTLRVQHCVLNRTVRQYGNPVSSDILGANYFHTVEPDTEFPKYVPRLELFLRLLVWGKTSNKVRIRIAWMTPGAAVRAVVYDKIIRVNLAGAVDFAVVDQGVKILGLMLPGEGTYEVRIYHPVKRDWGGRRWVLKRTEYFYVWRTP